MLWRQISAVCRLKCIIWTKLWAKHLHCLLKTSLMFKILWSFKIQKSSPAVIRPVWRALDTEMLLKLVGHFFPLILSRGKQFSLLFLVHIPEWINPDRRFQQRHYLEAHVAVDCLFAPAMWSVIDHKAVAKRGKWGFVHVPLWEHFALRHWVGFLWYICVTCLKKKITFIEQFSSFYHAFELSLIPCFSRNILSGRARFRPIIFIIVF